MVKPGVNPLHRGNSVNLRRPSFRIVSKALQVSLLDGPNKGEIPVITAWKLWPYSALIPFWVEGFVFGFTAPNR
jgi:hypothetical protein